MQQLHAVQVVSRARGLYDSSRVLLLEPPYDSAPWLELLPAGTSRLALGLRRTVFERSQTAHLRLAHSRSIGARTTDFPSALGDDPGAHGIAVRTVCVLQ